MALRPGPPVFACTTDAEWVAQTAKQKFALREPAFPAILKKKSYKNCVPKICGPRHLFTLEPPICDGYTVFSSRHLWRVESSSPLAHRFGIMVLRFGIMGKSGENNPLSSFSLCAGHTGFPDPELRSCHIPVILQARWYIHESHLLLAMFFNVPPIVHL